MTDWKTYKLGEITQIIGGGTPKTTVEQYWNGEIGWLTPRDLTGYTNKFISNGERNITEIGLKNSSARLMPKGTVLMTSRAPIGYIAIASKELCTNQGFKSFVVDEKKIKNEFLYYSLKNNIDKIKSLGTGSTFAEVSGSILKDFEISAPDLATQTQIAQILTSLDDKIEHNLQMNQTLEAMAQAIFKEWFVDFKFPGFDGELEEGLPKGWRMGKLGEVVSFVKGVSYRSSELVPSKFALVTLKSFNRNGGLNYRGFKEFFGKYKETQVLNEGDVIIAQTDITQAAEVIGCPAIVENPFEYEKLIASIDIVKCVPINTHFSEAILFYFLNDKRFKDYCLSHTNGSTVLHLRSSELPNFEFPIPDNELLKQFTEIINPIREKIISNNKQIQTLTATRDALLPKLMSGKIDVMTTLAVAQKQINDAKI